MCAYYSVLHTNVTLYSNNIQSENDVDQSSSSHPVDQSHDHQLQELKEELAQITEKLKQLKKENGSVHTHTDHKYH